MTRPRPSLMRTGHGQGAGRPHIEIVADELSRGIPEPARPAAARDASGKFIPSDGTRALARKGGKAKAESVQLQRLLSLAELPTDHAFAPYARLAREWRDDHMRQLAATVGGGEVGAGPASIVSSAALQLAGSRWLSDRGAELADPKLLLDASRLADASRQNLLAAHELAAREAASRPKQPSALALALTSQRELK